MEIVHAHALLWGFLVGFIGWGECARLPVPVAAWLLGHSGSEGIVVTITRLLVALFLIVAILSALCFVPFLQSVRHDATGVEPHLWRDLYGLSFVSSLIGFVSLGLMRRLRR